MSSVKSVDTYMFENGNSGYYRLSISVKFMDGSVFSDTLNTGLSCTFANLMLCDIGTLLNGELTETGDLKLETWKSKAWWSEAVIVHDEQVIKDLEEELTNMKFCINQYKLQNSNKDSE